jgi:C4-dicarboxylate-specific signal transduction histidine kinase
MTSEKTPGNFVKAPSSSDSLCLNLSHGLHAAAQPLTILRASLSNTNQMSLAELHHLVANSAKEVERVCTLFSYIQQLVINESIKPHIAETQIVPLIDDVADGLNLLFRESEMTLNVTISDACNTVLIDRVRTRQALSSIMLIAHGVSNSKDTIDLTATSSFQSVQIIVANSNRHPSVLSAEGQLSIALAETNMRNQRGGLEYSLNPFSVCIELPIANDC